MFLNEIHLLVRVYEGEKCLKTLTSWTLGKASMTEILKQKSERIIKLQMLWLLAQAVLINRCKIING